MLLESPFHFYWNNQLPIKGLFGASVSFPALDKVIYHNEFLPNGTTVVEWSSKADWNYRRESMLPKLEMGKHYTISRVANDEGGIKMDVSVQFFNAEGNRMSVEQHNLDEFDFMFPFGATSYTVELIGLEDGEYEFNQLTLRPKLENGYQMEGDESYESAPSVHTYTYLPQGHNKKARVIFSEPTLVNNDFPFGVAGPLSGSVLYISDSRLSAGFYNGDDNYQKVIIDAINKFKSDNKFEELEIIGYGPISSTAAVYYAQKTNNESLVSYDYITDKSKFLSEHDNVFYRNIVDNGLEVAKNAATGEFFKDPKTPTSELKIHVVDYVSRLLSLPVTDDAVGEDGLDEEQETKEVKKHHWWQFGKKK